MKNLIFKLLFFPVLVAICAFQNYELINIIETEIDYFTTDNLGNIYIIKGEELIKYDPNGNLLQRHSNKKLGKVYSVDVSNPLKILLFYKDFSTIVFLDNMLAQYGNPINLNDLQLEQASLSCSSHNNSIWVYDPISFQLIRLDQHLNVIQQTGNLVQQLGHEINPDFILEYNNWMYLNNPETGILVFDIYGTYLKTIPIKGIKEFQVMDNLLIYFKEKELFGFHLKSFENSKINLPETVVISARLGSEKILIQNPTGVSIYNQN